MRIRPFSPISVRSTLPLLLVAATLCAGCASSLNVAPPIRMEAELGRVVIYRNGVAYFQRRAKVRGNALKLAVPSERVDDFLKSLTVTDVRTANRQPHGARFRGFRHPHGAT